MTFLLNAALLCVVILLIWPRPIKQSLHYLALGAALCAVVCGVFFIVQRMEADDTVFSVRALDSGNESAEGSEIWIKSVVIDGVEQAPETVFSWGWIIEDGYLKWRNYDQPEGLPDVVYATIPGQHDVDILFQSNRWRGIAEVREGKYVTFKYKVDCYSNVDGDTSAILNYRDVRTFSGIQQVEGKLLFVCFLSILLIATVCSLPAKKGPVGKTGQGATEREFWLDVLKALAAPLIVLIHTVGSGYGNTPVQSGRWFGYLILNAVPRCAVPIFIMISGILLIGREVTMGKVWHNVKKAVLLLMIWNAFYIFLQAILWGPEEPIWRQIISIPVKRGPAGHLWYSYFLVWLYLFAPLISTLYKTLSKRMRMYFVLLTVIIPGVLDIYLKTLDINSRSTLYAYQLYMTLNYIGIMFLGRIIYDRAIQPRRPVRTYLGTAVLGLGVLIAGTYLYCQLHEIATDMYMSETQLLPVCYSAGLLGLASIYRDKLQIVTGPVRRTVEWLAQHALGIYFIHVFNIWTIGNIQLGNFSVAAENNGLQAIFLCAIYYLVSVFEVALMDRIPILRKLVV